MVSVLPVNQNRVIGRCLWVEINSRVRPGDSTTLTKNLEQCSGVGVTI